MKAEIFKRIILSALGGGFIGAGVGMAVATSFGADALGMLWEGIAGRLPLSVGQASLLVVAVCLVIVFIINKKELGISTFINPFMTSFFTDLLIGWIKPGDSIALRVVFLVLGIVLIGVGGGISAACNTGKDSYNAVVFALNSRFGYPVALTRSGLDLLCFILGLVLGAGFKIGPILGILLIGVVLNQTTKLFEKIILDRKK